MEDKSQIKNKMVYNIDRFSIKCQKLFRNCFGFALLRFLIG